VIYRISTKKSLPNALLRHLNNWMGCSSRPKTRGERSTNARALALSSCSE
jgi:hypothetical protein